MSYDEERLDDFPDYGPPLRPLDPLPYARQVGELIRTRGALEHWRQRCQESFREFCQRGERFEAWWQERNEQQFGDGEEPYAGGPLPFTSRHALSLPDCYLILALLHEATRRDAGGISLFRPDDWEGRNFYHIQRGHGSDLRESDQATLDECLARVQVDLAPVANTEAASDPHAIPASAASPRHQTPTGAGVLLPEDTTILVVLAGAGHALIYSKIVREAAKLVRAKGGNSAQEAGLLTLSETKVGERVPILESQGLVNRPFGKNGRPSTRKGVGITDKGRARLKATS